MGVLCLLGMVAVPLFNYKPKESIRWRMACQANASRLANAFFEYYKEHGSYPPAFVADRSGSPMHSWRVLILPYLGEQRLYRQYDFSEPWNGPHNSLLADSVPSVFQCPLVRTKNMSIVKRTPSQVQHENMCAYSLITGINTAFRLDKESRISDILDGRERTLFIIEHAGKKSDDWMKPSDISLDDFVNMSSSELGIHSRSFNAVFANGSVVSLPSSINITEKRELVDPADGLPHKSYIDY